MSGAALLLFAPAIASAHPVNLYYWPEPDGSGYDYQFTLQVDSPTSGGTLNWIVFGDIGQGMPNNSQTLLNPYMTSAQPAPFPDPMTSSGGWHAGPTFLAMPADYGGWLPTGVGDSISWSTHADSYVAEGDLYWSHITGTEPIGEWIPAILSCEGHESPLASKQDGVCAGSEQDCVDNQLVEPDYALIPGYEDLEVTCDGLDNDCDGLVDEDLIAPDATLQDGLCAGAVQVCAGADGWVDPDYAAYDPDYEEVEATCDALDNDCDGEVDEELVGEPVAGTGVCDDAVQVCEGGAWVDGLEGLEGYEETETSCDDLDNDCDGTVDEDCERTYTQVGGCACDASASEPGGILAILLAMTGTVGLVRRRR
jgi:uncharacterized protein (TIGR03382 family)